MKKTLFSLLALTALLVSCGKDPKPVGPEPEPEVVEAKLLSFSVTSGDVTIEGTVYEVDKVVELVYLPEQFDALKNATATITVSENATISPDPAEERDYTADTPVKYTVTNKDQVATYEIVPKAAEVIIKCEPVWDAPKTFGTLGVSGYIFNDGGVGFCDVDKFVTHDCQVFDLDGKKIGTLNTTGLPNSKLLSMANDEKGIFVATVGVSNDPVTNSDGPTSGDDLATGDLWAWLDGWDKAPTKVWGHNEAPVIRYMSVSGDLRGNFIITIIAPGRSATGTMFHCFVGTNGTLPGAWNAFNTTQPSNDGNWSQHVSAASGDPAGTFFVMDSRGENKGIAVYARKGIGGAEVALNGTMLDDNVVTETGHSGENQYGNYSIGHVRGFQYFGEDYVIVSSSGWPSAYLTIQPADANKDYILRTVAFSGATPRPSSAYVFDPATQTGHVIFTAADHFYVRYDITREII